MRISRLVASGLLLVALAAHGAAQDEYIKLKSGKVLKGRATAYDSDTKVQSFSSADGKEGTYPLDQLDERSVYLVHSSLVPRDNGRGQLQLANFARDAKLYKHAARRYGYALEADPSLAAEVEKERARARKEAADYCVANARAARAKGNTKEAEEWLTTLLEKLPDEPQAAEAARVLEQHYTQERDARDDQLEQEHAELLQKDLKQAKERYDRMFKRTQEGLTARSAKSVSAWEGALDDGEFCLKELERVSKKYPDDAHVQDGAAKYRKLIGDQMVEIHMHLASHYTMKSSYDKAMREANKALAIDPKSQAALAQRARIEQASSEGLGLDWF
jgi:tetratricopeptide (TPR) repeat protein